MKKLENIATVRSVDLKKGFGEKSIFVSCVGEFSVLDSADGYNNLIEIIPGSEILKDYLFHILKKPIRDLNKENKGTVIKKLFLVDVKNIEIPVPTLERQQKLLKSKNVEHRFIKFWLESGVRTYEKPLVVNMGFNDLLRLMKLPPKK
jgi:restriction endonuclease S subunit